MSHPPLFVKAVINSAQVTALQAMLVSHRRVRVLSGLRLALSAVIAIAGAVATLVKLPAAWVTVVAVAGAIWAGLYSIWLVSWMDGQLLRAAKLQEMFEVALFRLPWNTSLAGPQIRSEVASQLSKKFKGQRFSEGDDDDKDGWDKVPNLPRPFNVLALQIQNLGWGARIRGRYATAVTWLIAVWTAAGVGVGVANGFTVGQIVTGWFVPSLGGLLLGVDTVRQQRAVVRERERVCAFAEEKTLKAVPRFNDPATVDELLTLSRQVQDTLFSTRCRAPRAPSKPFYLLKYRDDENDFRAPVKDLADALTAIRTPTS